MKINLSKSRGLFYLNPKTRRIIPATLGRARRSSITQNSPRWEVVTTSEPSVTSPETLKEAEEVSSKPSLGINHNSHEGYRRTARARVKNTGWVNPRYVRSGECKFQEMCELN